MPIEYLRELATGYAGGFVIGMLLRLSLSSLPPSFQEGFWESFAGQTAASDALDTPRGGDVG